MLISDKIDFRAKKIIRQKRTLCNDNRSVHQKDTAILNMYAPDNSALKYM